MKSFIFRVYFFSALAFAFAQEIAIAAVGHSRDEVLARFEQQGIFDPALISEEDLLAHIQAVYAQETDPERQAALAERLLALKWMKLWDANAEMSAETSIIDDPLPPYFHPSENWQWSSKLRNPATKRMTRLHYAADAQGKASHRASGVFPSILPVNGQLSQEVYFPDEKFPAQVWIRIETLYVGVPKSKPITVQARWTQQPETIVTTENRPANFYAGQLPRTTGWHTFTVKLIDLGLCGTERVISNIEFGATGGNVWFGRTLIQRPLVEVRGVQKYNIFSPQEPFAFEVSAHNFSASAKAYQLDILASDYEGMALRRETLAFSIPPHGTQTQPFMIPPDAARYITLEYTLREKGIPVYHGYSAAAAIVSNVSGRKPDSPFGMMYWDQPGREIREFYEKLGVKLIAIFPQIERLHLFDSGAFEIMPMIWALPQDKPTEEKKLRQQIPPYFQAGQRIFSNFWETDLRVPAQLFAVQMRRFTEIVKEIAPNAMTVVGGMAWFNVAYVQQLLQALNNGTPYFDAITAMSYNTPAPPEYAGLDEDAAALRTLFETYGVPQTELWNVEWAYFENLNLNRGEWQNTGVAQEQIAAYTIRHHLLGFASGINRMIPGTNIYAGRTPLSKNYGHSMSLGRSSIFRYDLTPLPLLLAYSTMTRFLEDAQFLQTLDSGDANVICQLYRRKQSQHGDGLLLAAWTAFDHQNVVLRLPSAIRADDKPVSLSNMLGEEQWRYVSDGKVHLDLSPEPCYLLLPNMMDEELLQLNLSVAEPLLTVEPRIIEAAPGVANTVSLTFHLHNAGDAALRGELRLRLPDGAEIASQKIQYQDSMSALLAQKIELDEHEILLGRGHGADVIAEIALPETLHRNAYYEQVELGRQSDVNIMAEFVSGGRGLASATASVRYLPPLDVRLRPVLKTAASADAPTLQVRITNHSAVPREGEVWLDASGWVQIAPLKQSFSLAPGASGTYDFTLTGMPEQTLDYLVETTDTALQRVVQQVKLQEGEPMRLTHYLPHSGYLVTFGVGEGYFIEALVQEKAGLEARQGRGFAFRPAMKAKTPLTIDGNLSDWSNAVPLFVNPANRLNGLTFFANMYGGKMQWTGNDDFSAAWQMMWDDNFLYLATRTFDDHVVPQQALRTFWNGDVLSLQIDPLPDESDASILPVPRDLRQIHTFDIGMNASPIIRRKYATFAHPAGTVASIRIAANAMPDGIQYELAIPWTELDPLQPISSGWFGASFAWYEDDGSGRETYINWFGGSGGNGLAREPRLFGDIHLVEDVSLP